MENSRTERDESDHQNMWKDLLTEARHPASGSLDTMAASEIVALILEEDRAGLEAALHHVEAIALAADWVAETLQSEGTVVLAGAGTSGRLAVLEAAECPPTFGTPPERIRGIMAGGPEAVFTAVEGAEDRSEKGRSAVDNLGKGDLLIALSASSVTPFAVGALEAARSSGARTILLTCAAAEGLGSSADLILGLETGPEILTGSTRMKAGSVTKAVLNAITTAAMVRLGKAYENLMVDLKPTSRKLHDRSRRIVEIAGAVSGPKARDLLVEAEGEVKTAIVMARCGLDVQSARRRLHDTDGHVRPAIDPRMRDKSPNDD